MMIVFRFYFSFSRLIVNNTLKIIVITGGSTALGKYLPVALPVLFNLVHADC